MQVRRDDQVSWMPSHVRVAGMEVPVRGAIVPPYNFLRLPEGYASPPRRFFSIPSVYRHRSDVRETESQSWPTSLSLARDHCLQVRQSCKTRHRYLICSRTSGHPISSPVRPHGSYLLHKHQLTPRVREVQVPFSVDVRPGIRCRSVGYSPPPQCGFEQLTKGPTSPSVGRAAQQQQGQGPLIHYTLSGISGYTSISWDPALEVYSTKCILATAGP